MKRKAVCAEGGLGTVVYDTIDASGFINLIKAYRHRGIGTDVVGVGVIGNKPRTVGEKIDHYGGDHGGQREHDSEALLACALFKLTCRRGALPFLPELGSSLRELGKAAPSERDEAARQYAAQALASMGIEVTAARVRMISDTQADVRLTMSCDGNRETVEVRV